MPGLKAPLVTLGLGLALRNKESSVSDIGDLLVGVSVINLIDRLFDLGTTSPPHPFTQEKRQ